MSTCHEMLDLLCLYFSLAVQLTLRAAGLF